MTGGQTMAIEPITLTELGEKLLLNLPEHDYLTDERRLPKSRFVAAGIHEADSGFVCITKISSNQEVIYCYSCGGIIVIPTTIDTYEKLREYCKRRIESVIYSQRERD